MGKNCLCLDCFTVRCPDCRIDVKCLKKADIKTLEISVYVELSKTVTLKFDAFQMFYFETEHFVLTSFPSQVLLF